MKNKTYELKSLIVVTIIAFIFIVLTSYFVLSREQYREELATVQNELVSTQEELATTQENYRIETEKSIRLGEKLNKITNDYNNVKAKLQDANTTIADLKSEEYKLVYIGDYKLTHYCTEKRAHICGTGAGITATGTQVTAGRTIAVDPRVIPYGTKVYIEGYGWRMAEDCGGAVKGSHIDIAVETHSQATSMGTKTGGVWILIKKGS